MHLHIVGAVGDPKNCTLIVKKSLFPVPASYRIFLKLYKIVRRSKRTFFTNSHIYYCPKIICVFRALSGRIVWKHGEKIAFPGTFQNERARNFCWALNGGWEVLYNFLKYDRHDPALTFPGMCKKKQVFHY